MSNLEEVERPVDRKFATPETRAVLATLETGKAIKIPINGTTVQRLRSRFAQGAKRIGCQSHVRVDGDYVIAWVTKR